MSLLNPSAKIRRVIWIVLAALVAGELFIYYWLDGKIDDYRYNQPTLIVTACSIEGDQFMVTVENLSAKRYRGMPAVYVLDAPSLDSHQMWIQPDGYYAEINRNGLENYNSYAVVPPQESVTLCCTLSEKELQSLEALQNSAQALYACVPPSHGENESNLQFCRFS